MPPPPDTVPRGISPPPPPVPAPAGRDPRGSATATTSGVPTEVPAGAHARLRDAARAALAARGDVRPPPGHPGSLGLCVVEAVQAPRLRASTTAAVVARYRDLRRRAGADPDADGPGEVLEVLSALGDDGWAGHVGTRHRAWPAPDAPLRATATRRAAQVLVDAGAVTTDALLALARGAAREPASEEAGRWWQVRDAWREVPGQRSGLSWHWLHLLAGSDVVVPGPPARRVVAAALDLPLRAVSAHAAATTLERVARDLGASARELDHALWRHEAGRRGRPRPPATP